MKIRASVRKICTKCGKPAVGPDSLPFVFQNKGFRF